MLTDKTSGGIGPPGVGGGIGIDDRARCNVDREKGVWRAFPGSGVPWFKFRPMALRRLLHVTCTVR